MKRMICTAFLLVAAGPIPKDVDAKAQAKCLIHKDRRGASAFASSVPGSEAEHKALADLRPAMESCGIDRTPSDDRALILGGVVAETIRRADYPRIIKGSYRGLDDAHMDAIGVSEQTLDRAKSWPRNVAVVYCATARNPRYTDEILGAKPGSSRERALVGKLMPAFGRCVDSGQSVRISPAQARAVMARQRYSDGFAGDPFLSDGHG